MPGRRNRIYLLLKQPVGRKEGGGAGGGLAERSDNAPSIVDSKLCIGKLNG